MTLVTIVVQLNRMANSGLRATLSARVELNALRSLAAGRHQLSTPPAQNSMPGHKFVEPGRHCAFAQIRRTRGRIKGLVPSVGTVVASGNSIRAISNSRSEPKRQFAHLVAVSRHQKNRCKRILATRVLQAFTSGYLHRPGGEAEAGGKYSRAIALFQNERGRICAHPHIRPMKR
jgi:hypothetical protein